jgi:hypothetical protein
LGFLPSPAVKPKKTKTTASGHPKRKATAPRTHSTPAVRQSARPVARKASGKRTKAAAKARHAAPSDPIVLVESALAGLGADFRAFSCKKDPPSQHDLSEAERALGRPFPADYRKFIERWGSLVLDVTPDVWRRPVEFEVRPSWQMDYARVVFGIAPQPEWVRVEVQHRALTERRGPGFLPVMRRLSGNGDVYGYTDDDDFALLAHDTGDLEPAEPFFETLIAEIRSLHVDRERLRTSPIPAA